MSKAFESSSASSCTLGGEGKTAAAGGGAGVLTAAVPTAGVRLCFSRSVDSNVFLIDSMVMTSRAELVMGTHCIPFFLALAARASSTRRAPEPLNGRGPEIVGDGKQALLP